MDDVLGRRVSKLEIVPESEEARPADRVQIGFGRRLDTRTRHGGDGLPQSPKRGGRIAGQGKRLHPVDPPFPGPAARAIQKNAPDRPSSGICVRRHRIAPPSGQAPAYASEGSGTGRDGLRPLPFSSRFTPCRHAVRRSPYSTERGNPRRTGGRPSRPSLRQGGVARGAEIAIRNLDDGTRALPRIRAAGGGRSVEGGRIPGTPSGHSRPPDTR